MMLETLLVAWAAFGALPLALSWQAGRRNEHATRHPLRRRLFEIIWRRPGVRLATLWQMLNANRGTAKYHLMILERAHAVTAVRAKRITRYFPSHMSPAERSLASLLLRGRVLDMVRAVVRRPGISQHELGTTLRMSRKVLREYANLLLQHGLVEEARGPHSRRYYATPRLDEALRTVSPEAREEANTKEAPGAAGGGDSP